MEPSDNNWKIKLLYDGGCPICMIEVQRWSTS
jgi:predicted DCC family thiol-disulfide oxidoreductase YuxK